MGKRRLTDLDLETANQMFDDVGERAYRPLDIGGHNGSHHSATLAKLERRGLVASRQRSAHGSRGSKLYWLTPEGKEAVSVWRQEKCAEHALTPAAPVGATYAPPQSAWTPGSRC